MLCICKSNSEIKSKIRLDIHIQIEQVTTINQSVSFRSPPPLFYAFNQKIYGLKNVYFTSKFNHLFSHKTLPKWKILSTKWFKIHKTFILKNVEFAGLQIHLS